MDCEREPQRVLDIGSLRTTRARRRGGGMSGRSLAISPREFETHLRSVAQRTKAALSGNHRPREGQRLLQQNLPIAVISPEMRLNRPVASMLKS